MYFKLCSQIRVLNVFASILCLAIISIGQLCSGCGCDGIKIPKTLENPEGFGGDFCGKELEALSKTNKCPDHFQELKNSVFFCIYLNGSFAMGNGNRCSANERCEKNPKSYLERRCSNKITKSFSSSSCICPEKYVMDLHPLETVQYCGGELNKVNRNHGCEENRIVTCYRLEDGTTKTMIGTLCSDKCSTGHYDPMRRICTV